MEIYLNQPYSFCQIGKRSNQEDARYPDEDVPQDYKAAFVICDGVGGCDNGEIASRVVADSIGRCMQKQDLTKPFDIRDFEKILEKVLQNLDIVYKKYKREMATTLAFVCFHSSGAFVAHIGDSRIYHIRPNVGILYQSVDHSLVSALVHSGNLTPEEAMNHPQSNIITRCISATINRDKIIATTIQIRDIEEGDYFFLCTDGVVHQVSDQKLLEILSSKETDRNKIRDLSFLSCSSSDNNTAYLIGVSNVTYEEADIELSNAAPEINTASETRPIFIDNEEIVETKIDSKPSLRGHLSQFFNKLFLK